MADERILHGHIELDLLRVRAKQADEGNLSGRGCAICMYAAADEIERREREIASLRAQLAFRAARVDRVIKEMREIAENLSRSHTDFGDVGSHARSEASNMLYRATKG